MNSTPKLLSTFNHSLHVELMKQNPVVRLAQVY